MNKSLPHKKLTQDILRHWRGNVVEGLDEETSPSKAHYGKCLVQSSNFRTLALIDYYLGIAGVEITKLIERSAQFECQELALVQSGDIPAIEGAYPTSTAIGIATALVAKRKDIAELMSEQSVQLMEAGMLKDVMIYYDAFRWMFVYLTLGMDSEANEWADKVINHKRKSQRKFYLPLAHVTNALVDRDAAQVQKTLEEYLMVFNNIAKRGMYKDVAEGMMSFEGMALLVFARERGMDIRVDNPYIFYDLLE